MIYDFVPEQDLNGYSRPWPAGGGANQWDEVWEVGALNSNNGANYDQDKTRIRSKNYIPITDTNDYYVCSPATLTTICYYNSSKTFISSASSVSGNSAITPPENSAFMRFELTPNYGTEYKHDIAINYPSTVTTYSPYENKCPITGVDVPGIGTVYAGSIDTATREMILTHAIEDLSSLTWSYESSESHEYFQATLSTVKPAGGVVASLWCNVYKVITAGDLYQHTDDCSVAIHGTLSQVWVYDSRYTDATAFKAASAGNKIVYELLTPITVTLTEQQITALLGELGVARNFNSAEIMVNVWLYMAQGRDPSDLTRQVLRPISKPVIDKPIIFDDVVKELPADDVISPDEEPEENITEEKEEEDNASE